MMSSRRAAIYGRVSIGWQTAENQTVALNLPNRAAVELGEDRR